jgi:2-phospho-L-lactate guanylyltransferase
MRKVVAIIPVREFENTKLRLRNFLGESERAMLTRSMLIHVLATLERSLVEHVVVVASNKAQASRLGKHFSKATFISEKSPHGGVNDAMDGGIAYARHQFKGMDSVMLIPSDLPLLSVAAIDKALEKLESYDLILSPSAKRDGTSLILFDLLRGRIPFHYDDDSYQRHLNEARLLKIKYTVFEPKELLFDVDTPTDFRKLKRELKARSVRELSIKLEGPLAG